MLLLSRSWMVVIAAGLIVALAGCQPKTPPPSGAKPSGHNAAASRDDANKRPEADEHRHGPNPKPTIVKAKPEQPPPPPTIPKVALSGEIRAACLVATGDTMPGAELTGLDGKTHALESLGGRKLTVVCLWTLGTTRRSQLVSKGVLQDLSNDVAKPFAEKGVRVVAIDVGDTPQAVAEQVARAGATFPVLLDPKGTYFARLAKDRRMPRTYLISNDGRILWFDVEYSNTSRRELLQGIRVALGEL